MKYTIAFGLLFCSSLFAQKIIKHDDIFKKTSMKLNLDAVELWDIRKSDRAQAKVDFENRCYEEILGRLNNHYQKLEDAHEFFRISDVTTENSVIENKTRRGIQLLCQSSIELKESSGLVFELDYSKIFRNGRKGTFKLCQKLISEIDRKAVKQGVIVRRAYYIYEQKNGKPFFPRCQTLAVRLKKID